MLVLMVFWMGLGGLGWFLDDLGLILMDFGCMLGWCLDGFLMVLAGFWMNVNLRLYMVMEMDGFEGFRIGFMPG